MNRNRLIFGGVIAVIAILSVGMVMAVPDTNKTATKLTIKAKSPVHEGDKITIKLTDAKKSPISNKTVKVKILDGANNPTWYSVVTNAKGVAKLKLDKEPGDYKVKCKFWGDKKYNESHVSQKITIEKIEEEPVEEDDSGSFYSGQAEDIIYTGEIHEGPDGNFYMHIGNNEWVQI